MRERRGEKRREKREGGVDHAATCCHALCCPVLWIYIYILIYCLKAVTFYNVFLLHVAVSSTSYT